jgi:hypothetical protein
VTTTVTYSANADAWVAQGSPSNNFAGDSILKVQSKGPSDNARALVRFSLPASPPAGCVVQSATLRLYAPSWTTGRTLQAFQLGASWSESSVTWANQPATAGTPATTTSGSGYRQWTVTSQVQAIFSSGANHGFLVRDVSENNGGVEQQFHSREKGETMPELVVTYAAPGVATPTLTPTATPTNTPIPPTATPTSTPISTTSPDTMITAGPGTMTTSTSATFQFSAFETGTTYSCSLDGAAFTACASPMEYTGLSNGPHTFSVRATDGVGNVETTPASYGWTIEAAQACVATTVTYSANADAWLDQGSASSNKGADSILKVQAKSSNNYRALVRFSLPASPPAGCVVQSATLRLYAPSWTTGRTLQAFQLGASWSESGVTWTNQPATTGTAATTTSGSGYRQWTVTSQVQAIFSSGANHGFLVRDATEGGTGREQQFHSREKGSNMPQLVVTFGP